MAKTSIVGLDIGSTAIRAAELSISSGKFGTDATLTKFAQVALPIGALQDGEVVEPGTVSSTIKLLWEQGKFSSKDVVIGVGNQRVIVREADLPWQPLDGLKKSLPYQAQQLLPTAAGDALLDFVPTDEYETADGRYVAGLFVAAIRETVTANVLASESGGVRPMVVDLNAFAIQRALTQGELAQYTVAIVDVGARITNIVIAEHGKPRFVRVIPHGGQEATDTVAHAFGCTLVEAERAKREIGVGMQVTPDRAHAAEALMGTTTTLVESIRSTFVYYQSKNLGAPIDAIILSGGGSLLNGFGQYLSSATRLPVQLSNPLERVKVAKGVDLSAVQGSEQMLSTVLGLAYGVA
ncbi:type IV pilus assembly protein PilM [Populibacterium corticicola]|uniref:Type IV pilus assembly protein PilM n=1 Tax=Populibacterium corticicola TaxID=1812826 RepID=A0ABW5XB25_9MICO